MQKKTLFFGALLVVILLETLVSAQMRQRGSMKASCLSYDCMPVENLDLDERTKGCY